MYRTIRSPDFSFLQPIKIPFQKVQPVTQFGVGISVHFGLTLSIGLPLIL